jgi:hypothetical protein
MTNDFKMIVFKQWTISIKTQHEVLCIHHGMENGGRISWEKKKSSVSINAEKTSNAPNNVERFKVPTVLKHFEIAYVLHHLYIMHNNVMTSSDDT